MDLIALGGLALVLLIKEAGVPIPVPGDLLVIGPGAALAGDPPFAFAALGVILLVGWIGGSVQFLLMRRAVRGPLFRLLSRFVFLEIGWNGLRIGFDGPARVELRSRE